MNLSILVWFWLIVGVVLMVAEFILPGLVSVFFGAAAIIIAALVYFDIISGWVSSITVWMFLSLLMVLTLRQFIAKLLPANSEVKHTDDDLDAIGAEVTVTKEIQADNNEGRIRYQGTDWPARSMNETIAVGSKATILLRENITWITEEIK